MMKRLLLLAFLLTALNSWSQPYRNEWISFSPGQPWSSQQYFRIAVWQPGIYRVSYSELQNNGVPVSSWFQAANYQLFFKGREQFIRVIDQNSDNLFTAGDFLEFYGTANDGELDAFLYDSLPSHPNPYYSLFNDTASYFLTYNPFVNGRRMPVENDQNFNAYPAAAYAVAEQLRQFTSDYNLGIRDGNGVADNSYTSGEGFCSNRISYQSFLESVFNVQKLVPGFVPEARVTVMGANQNFHPYEVRGNGVPFVSESFIGYEFYVKDFNPSNIANGNYPIRLQPLPDPNFAGNENYMQSGYMRLRYGRSFDFTGETLPQRIMIQGAGLQKVLVQFSGITVAAPVLYMFSGDTIRKVVLTANGSLYQALIPVFGRDQQLYLGDDNAAITNSSSFSIKSVNSNPDPSVFARFTNFQVQGAGKQFLIVSHKVIWNKAVDYFNYRTSTGHNPLLADIDELYDQFAWGIKKHHSAIRNFSDFMIDNGGGSPKWLYLIGKSVLSMNARSGNGYTLNLVPTFGEPASDQMYTSKLNTSEFKPELSTGRLSAQNETDIQNYLEKIQAFDAAQLQPPQEWMKHVLHFGGGTNIDEQNLLASKLNIYKTIVEDTLFGGKVFTLLKSSSAPIQVNQSQYLQALIDSGCSMMTFYGHAAGSTFDISTDDPENYNNTDRYPVVLAQSCFVGDIHTTQRLLNERFVLLKDKGSVGFIAVPDKGIIDPLDDYSIQLHKNLFQLNYGESIGENMKQTVADIILDDFARKSVCMNMTLHGDPAIVMYQYPKPDYAIENQNIFFEPAVVTTDLDSFTVKFAISNLGRNINSDLDILLIRKFPDNSTKDTILTVPYVTYRDTFSVRLPVDIRFGPGINNFEVTLDVYDKVDEEINFSNNIANASLSIESNDINPVLPQQYAIIPSPIVKLKATTSSLFSGARNYRFEIDTTILFSSPVIKTGLVANAYGIVEWPVPGVLDSNLVYFWRVANDSITNPDTSISKKFQWRNSSFIVKPGINGWSQSHYHQLLQTDLVNIERLDALRAFKFVQSQYSLVATHNGNVPSYDINGSNIDYGGCTGTPQIAVAVIDSINFEKPWSADTCQANRYFGNFNPYNCNTLIGCNRNRPDNFFLFNATSPASMDSLIDMLNNDIPSGNYILSWSLWNMNFTNISDVINAYVNLGATDLQNVQNGDKFLLFLKKGEPSTAVVEIDTLTSSLRIDYSLTRDWDKGFMSSTEIGPALQWNNVHWNYNSIEPVSSPDSMHLQIFGIDAAGTEVLLRDSLSVGVQPVDISWVSAAQYPKLRLKAYLEDKINLSAPQLARWQVYYEPVPEGAVDPRYVTFYKDSLQEGDSVRFSIAFANISNKAMDTLTVDYFVFDNSNVRRSIATVKTTRGLAVNDTVMTSIQFSTEGLVGKNTLWAEVNPRNIQPEQNHFNNLASKSFAVTRDITNPLLDVTFDGLHILNGDIISAKPGIQIQLLDENRFLALNDTANYRVSLRWPDGTRKYLNFETTSDVSTNNELLKWSPAVLPKNSFRINYTPQLAQDGIYELQVQAADISGNLSGSKDYKVQFEVINRSTITEVVNYPNPFSTSTRFVFVLTGSEVPNDFRIQIMTVTGKIIREVSRAEIGDIHIGRNITEFAWDGKDQFGDQLANGVYLYRVITKINDSNIEKRATEADGYFKKGWGKMYLMR
jgi:hypothetical protein